MSDALQTTGLPADALMGEIVDEFLDRCARGEEPDVEEYAERHPELAGVLRKMLPALLLMRSCGGGPGVRADSGEIRPEAPLGDYRLVRELGRGGMGVVYEAEQLSLGRRVALKVLPMAAALDARQLQRFRNEAQAAASLHHTNIVPVYGVGCERGVHFYAMQFIDGQPLSAVIEDLRRLAGFHVGERDARQEAGSLLDEVSECARELASGAWARRAPRRGDPEATVLTPREQRAAAASTQRMAALSTEQSHRSPAYFETIARLGIQAAEALEHAHQFGVIHRDVKPANLLLDAAGHLWVTDFGLAHIQTDGRLTMTGDLIGTLRYMSPEQALAQRVVIDHRTDIYSLGVTLYEMLTLEPAFPAHDRQALLRHIAFDDPRPPRQVNTAVPAELETIVLKAIAKNPEERYRTSQDLADDLRRFLEDKPIRARRPTLLQKAVKWSRRHRPVVWSVGIATLVVLVTAVVLLAISNVRIAQERSIAEERGLEAQENLRKARQAVDEYFTRVSENTLLQEPELEPLRRELLQDALNYYKQFAREHQDDSELQAELVVAHLRISNLTFQMGPDEDWVPPFRTAVNLLEDLLGRNPSANTLEGLRAEVPWSNAVRLFHVQDPDAARETFEKARVLWEELARRDPAARSHRYTLAVIHAIIGCLHWYRADTSTAEQVRSFQRAADLCRQLIGEDPHRPQYRAALASISRPLAVHLAVVGDQARADAAIQEAQQTARQLVADFPGVPGYQELARCVIPEGAALLHEHAGRLKEAETAYRDLLAGQEALRSRYPTVTRYQAGSFYARQSLGMLLWYTGRREEAAGEFRQVRDLGEQIQQEDLEVRNYLAWLLATCPDEQFRNSSRAIELARTLVEVAPRQGDYWMTLGAAHYAAGEYEAAVSALEKSLQVPNGWGSRTRFCLARACAQLERQDEARRWYDEGVVWMERDRRSTEALYLRDETRELLGIEADDSQ